MSTSSTTYSFNDEWDLISIKANRASGGMPLSLELRFQNQGEQKKLKLVECRDYGIIEALLEAERISISKDQEAQTEFGNIHVKCFGECYSEHFCDDVYEIT